MKNLILIFSVLFVLSCSKDEELIEEEIIEFNTYLTVLNIKAYTIVKIVSYGEYEWNDLSIGNSSKQTFAFSGGVSESGIRINYNCDGKSWDNYIDEKIPEGRKASISLVPTGLGCDQVFFNFSLD
jgi:hypothetical protein|tara:strand:- start:533 stop:910 length:378 start_codon:yes stop_codon:yes gene_type:complete